MSNKAAWLKTFKGETLTIEDAPMPSPQPHQILIKTRAIGINPADAAVQRLGMIYDASKFPIIMGFDVAGEVEAVGDEVTRFKVGDRVCAFPIDLGSHEDYKSQRGAFQSYCVANAALVAHVPENVGFAEAAVFPSCLSTAAYAMFMKEAMALSLPPVAGKAEPNGQVVVVWGGSSVVGSCAIQMATLAGYEVVATSSERNFEHCRSLGAMRVFDYKSESVVDDVVAACEGKKSAGVFVAYYNDESTVTCSHIASRLGGNAVVGTVVPPNLPTPEAAAKDVKITSNWGPGIGETEEGIHIWQKWLTPALADGRLQLSPRPEIAGQGLEALQGAVDTMFGRIHMFELKAGEQKKSINPGKIVVEI